MPSDNKKILILVVTLTASIISIVESYDDSTVRATRSIEISTRKNGKLSSEEIGDLKNTERLTTKNYLNSYRNDESLVMESAGGGKSKQKENDNDDDEKKTLSQQVAEGKYGLIQKELFSKPAKSLGIISYVENPEVPKDNIKNLGGLTPDDIWLAEDHLLILKGGVFPAHTTKTNVNWPPIDNYKAPRRQVKIPYNPKIPPPFPVQLQDNGPIQLIGPNGTTRIISKGDNSVYPPEGYAPGTGPFFSSEKENNGDTPFPIPPYGIPPPGNFSKGSGPLPFPYPPPSPPPRGIRPLVPFIESLPPNAVYLPPPGNQTDMYDDEDPSIYYPPPYSFYYSTDNTSKVEPGPLVPGIILPPPPDFFSLLDSNTTRKENKSSTTTTTGNPITEIHAQIPPTTTPKVIVYEPETIKPNLFEEKPERIPIHIPENDFSDTPENDIEAITTPIPITYTIAPIKKTILTTVKTTEPQYYTTEPHHHKPHRININAAIKKTKLYPQKDIVSTTTPHYNDYPEAYYDDNTVISNKNTFKPVYGPPKKPIVYNNGRVYISSTPIPLKAFFTTNSEIESNSVTADPINYYQQRQASLAIRASPPLKSKAEFYYYEEPKTSTERKQIVNEYYNQQSPQSNIRTQPYYETSQTNGRTKALYIAIPANQNLQNYPQSTLKTVDPISRQIVQLQQEIQSYLTSPRYKIKSKPPTTSKPIYEYSFQAANYVNKNTNKNDNDEPFRPIIHYNNNIYATTPTSNYNYNAEPIKQHENYSNQKYEYEEVTTRAPPRPTTNQPRHTYRKASYQNFNPTENPVNYAYYTKQDEKLLDDITKEYFTVFGQKIENGKVQPILTTPIQNVISTTPLPKYSSELQNSKEEYIETLVEPIPSPPALHPTNIEVKFGDNTQKSPQELPKKISLHSDILVNYNEPRPPINPNSEWIPQHPHNIQSQSLPISLETDINVNNKYPRPPINPHAEYITQIKINPYAPTNHRNPNAEPLDEYNDYTINNSPEVINHGYIQQTQPLKTAINNNPYSEYSSRPITNYQTQQSQKSVGEGQPGQIIAFRLPGNGAHFYFITPQVSSQVVTRQKQNLNNNAYVYQEPNQRLRRSRSRFRERQQIYNIRS